jgi:hypothetical protein
VLGLHASWINGSEDEASSSPGVDEESQGENDEFCVNSVWLPLFYVAKFGMELDCSKDTCRLGMIESVAVKLVIVTVIVTITQRKNSNTATTQSIQYQP